MKIRINRFKMLCQIVKDADEQTGEEAAKMIIDRLVEIAFATALGCPLSSRDGERPTWSLRRCHNAHVFAGHEAKTDGPNGPTCPWCDAVL